MFLDREHLRGFRDAAEMAKHLDKFKPALDKFAFQDAQHRGELANLIRLALEASTSKRGSIKHEFDKNYYTVKLYSDSAVQALLRGKDQKFDAVSPLLDSPAFKQPQDVRRRYDEILQAFESPTMKLLRSGAARQRELLQNALTLSPALAAFANAATELETDVDVSGTFIGQLLTLLQQLLEAVSAESIEERATQFENFLLEKVTAVVPGMISFEGMVNIILSLCLFAVSDSSSTKTEQRLTGRLERIEESQKTIIRSVERLIPTTEDHRTYYVVTHPTKIVLRPMPKSPTVAKLYPNQKIAVENQKGAWLYVE